MSDSDKRSFLQRWSDRKLTREPPEQAAMDAGPDAVEQEEQAPLDLPSIDSLTSDSDYTQFLQQGVPQALRIASLRRAWVTDPAIAGHKSMADYDWDFNAPGYGALRPSDDVRKIAEAILNPPPPPPPAEPQTPAVDAAPAPVLVAAAPSEPLPSEPDIEKPLPRKHGSALPD